MNFFLNFLILATTVVACVKAQDYSHGDQSAWNDVLNWQCNGNVQSPIALDRNSATKAFGNLRFVNYNANTWGRLWNNGHTVEIQFESNTAYVTSTWLPDSYNLQSAHFHWGPLNSLGSEHIVDGQRHSLELHLVHYNSKYGNMDNAADKEDGLLVVATFFQVSDPYVSWDGLNSIVSSLPLISAVGASEELDSPILLSDLLNLANFKTFFNYKGSLTTPPCTENVNWFVSPNPVPISSDDADAFRSLLDKDGNLIRNNFRWVHSRNNREVRFVIQL
ncbi:hypothetical protein DOY81_004285 [Sarcophaga bullata]|nr:hypothetical protein DOY81_004285 [Sarcophaga bullata]